MIPENSPQVRPPAYLVLAEGSIFEGYAIGALGKTVGELVFNTAMTGYQEILTDPSYSNQMVTLTYPHIGNTGINPIDNESSKIYAAGLVIRELSPLMSSWRGTLSLEEHLIQQGLVAIAGVDTRALTRLLREKGAQNACIMTGVGSAAEALVAAQAYPGLKGMDLARVVSTPKAYAWTEGSYDLDSKTAATPVSGKKIPHVVVYDFGVKAQILRELVDRGCQVTVVPAQTPAAEVLALSPQGVVLSNGPGDPEPCDYAIKASQELMGRGIPLFGICLGHQLLGLACGAKTLKMNLGHHGANHPVKDLKTGKVLITSQNHGFAVDPQSLPADYEVTHVSLFDQSLQGFQHRSKPIMAFQGHPEASPGPQDIAYLFDRFVSWM